VSIPISDLLLRLRDKGKREGAESPGLPSMGPWAFLASQPLAWKAALLGGRIVDHVPGGLIPVAAFHAWTSCRTLPKWRGGAFRKWFKTRKK
jgi:L-lactate dehydrogenase complex protein LldF